jgi:hypothetical protein
MREFKITEDKIKRIAEEPEWKGSFDMMRSWFPEAFEPEWGEVPMEELRIGTGCGHFYLYDQNSNIVVFLRDVTERHKIENGKIYRKKS